MPTTLEELDRFHQFARERIRSGESALDLQELVSSWHETRERAEIKSILDRGIAEIKSGTLGRDAWDVSDELARKHGIKPGRFFVCDCFGRRNTI